MPLSPIDDVIADYRNGKMVIIVDDADRENEGDLALATEWVTPQSLAFMMHQARGLICVTISPDLAKRLELPQQVDNNNSPYRTPFAVSIDHRSVAEQGVTAAGRARTMQALLEPGAEPQEFVSPGHVFPLVANPAGVLGRRGQTEGSYDLAKLAGLKPSGIICEILNQDGSMARGEQLREYAERHGLRITSVAEIVRKRLSQEVLVRLVAHNTLTTDAGDFDTHVYRNDVDGKEHLALVYGSTAALNRQPVLVRIHSECLTGDVFGSRRCDCGPQLQEAQRRIVAEGAGIIVYLRQEGRGIGLGNKLRAYELQDHGRDTVQANIELGFEPDQRDFVVAAQILESLGTKQVRLLTNNPRKILSLESAGVKVTERVPLLVPTDEFSQRYLEAKREKLGHLL